MVVHSDLAAVAPEPWLGAADASNVIWCLIDVDADNGATLHIPGSHRYTTMADVPADPMAHMVPFEAAAGSIIVMEGRVWHTSGRNVTADEDRALLFGYYTKPFLRPQWNFTASLAPRAPGGDVTRAALPPRARRHVEHGVQRRVRPGGRRTPGRRIVRRALSRRGGARGRLPASSSGTSRGSV